MEVVAIRPRRRNRRLKARADYIRLFSVPESCEGMTVPSMDFAGMIANTVSARNDAESNVARVENTGG